ncbi:hypothetical protein Tco_1035629, partial [Tanacetum coccineum]
MMMGTKSDIEKFDGKNDFALWQVRMKALLEQQGLTAWQAVMKSSQNTYCLVKVDRKSNIDWVKIKKVIVIDSCTGLVKVLQGVEFEVEPQEDHTFKVEPHGNVDHVVGALLHDPIAQVRRERPLTESFEKKSCKFGLRCTS